VPDSAWFAWWFACLWLSPPPPPRPQVLCAELPALLSALSFKKSMRWRGDTAFSRPVRWLLALHGSVQLPFVWAGLKAGSQTRLLRNASQPAALVGDPPACT
jgi:glycyl-tRNA synthetase